jgi:hypothetical protein
VTKSSAISIKQEFTQVKCFENRTPDSSNEAMKNAFIKLTDFDNSAIYLSHYSGFSEWKRHPAGDEWPC